MLASERAPSKYSIDVYIARHNYHNYYHYYPHLLALLCHFGTLTDDKTVEKPAEKYHIHPTNRGGVILSHLIISTVTRYLGGWYDGTRRAFFLFFLKTHGSQNRVLIGDNRT